MRTITTAVYSYDELNEPAQAKAREWFAQLESEDFDADYILQDMAPEVCKWIGIDLEMQTVRLMGGGTRQKPVIHYSGFCSQGDGASFRGSYAYARGSRKAVREYPTDTDLHEIADSLYSAQRRHFYGLTARMSRGHLSNHCSHEMTIHIEVYDRLENDITDTPDGQVVVDAMRDMMRWIYRMLESEYDYRLTDEVVADNIRANNYEFTEDGSHA